MTRHPDSFSTPGGAQRSRPVRLIFACLLAVCLAGCLTVDEQEPGGLLGEVVHPPTLGPTPTLPAVADADLSALLDAEGRATEDITLDSADGWASLIIPEGTRVTGPDGEPAARLVLQPVYSGRLPTDAYGYAPGLGYEFGPEAVTFEPAAMLVFRYTEEAIKGIIPGDMGVGAARGTEEWKSLGSRLDQDALTLNAQVEHLEPGWRYVLLAPIPLGS